MHCIVIVGGGASGTILLINLLRKSPKPLVVKVIEKNEEVGRGVAYAPLAGDYLLNVPSSKMGLYAETVDDFFNWLLQNGYDYKGSDFVPRRIYGDYLVARLKEELSLHPQHEVTFIRDEVTDIEPGEGYEVHLASGERIYAREVVLAVGNYPPRPVAAEHNRVYNDPWTNGFWEKLNPEDTVVLLGTGLTAIDFVNELNRRKHTGKIRMLSRHGKLPWPHEEPCMQGLLKGYFSTEDSLRTVITKINAIKRHPLLKIVRPVCVIEELRNLFPRMWYHWSNEERDLFYRRLFPIWNINRHRIPPAVETIIKELVQAGQLEILSGSLKEVVPGEEQVKISYSRRQDKELVSVTAHHFLNCTGPECNFDRLKSPLTRNLLSRGIIETDGLKTGLLSNSRLQLKSGGEIKQHLWSIGPPLKSMFFESTAIHEIRNQANALSNYIINQLS